MLRFVVTIGLGLALVGCTREPIAGMALKCQTVACTCVAQDASFPVRPGADTVDVVWLDNGDASCPEGHVLREVAKD